MKKKLDIDNLKYWSKVILITLLIIFVLRCFLFELFTISTSQMEPTLLQGDKVLVSKLSYGARFPITPLNVPFTFDRFLGSKSYSDIVTLPYIRIFTSSIKPNDVVLFNSTQELEKPLDKRSLLINRCVAVPGDTIFIDKGVYYINNKQYMQSTVQSDEYCAPIAYRETIVKLTGSLGLKYKELNLTSDSVYFTLEEETVQILKRYLDENAFYKKEKPEVEDIIFIVPSKGRGVILSPKNIQIYRQIIEYEQGDKALFVDNEVYLRGEKIEIYNFEDDYYWMLSDNVENTMDSRNIGFIPFKNVVGRVVSILSSEAEGNRSFSSVN